MGAISLNDLNNCEYVIGDTILSTDDGLKPASSKFIAVNCAIIALSLLSLFITLFESLFKSLVKMYSLMVLNRIICTCFILLFLRYIRNVERANIKMFLFLHFINQANYFGTSITAIYTKIPNILHGYSVKSFNIMHITLIICFTAILIMETINLAMVYNIFSQIQRNLIIAKPKVNGNDLKLNLCIFTLFGYSILADCLYLTCSIITYVKYIMFNGFLTEAVLSSFSGICIFISTAGLILGISVINILR
ncbi:transmembrane domain-containing protein [Cryptosporidium canis]|uniref:Transmembrane domain-containing protein n=1 Tax=Cryptosporidium canis TaxID=195482 RepID=A0ABQ8P885_9CRYT|nr:transmembrane domain-containing protein [Cryptosporidium canis]